MEISLFLKNFKIKGKECCLSEQELIIGRFIIMGFSVSTIAIKRMKSVKTISTQKRSIYRKLAVRNDIEFIMKLSSMRKNIE
ncbi:helix-turn-helix transcriptional regulator [Serratia sp. T13T92]|jgi:two-component system capsular synthesis response regulator RcsB|uniref:helix-turn-helix transcriptional regulator n=1 Tax=Serratia sp. T13T92 TaxID=3397496 RepID=UPI0039E05A4A